MDVDTLITLLNNALSDEWLAYYQYWTGAKVVKGPMKDAVIAELDLHATEELGHAQLIATRIIQLGGTPVLTPEDGTFHGECFTGHKGFNTNELADLIRNKGFTNVTCRKCFVINKKINDSETRQFDVFLMISKSRNT
jgi:bacterioferritin (cytochrome b1)